MATNFLDPTLTGLDEEAFLYAAQIVQGISEEGATTATDPPPPVFLLPEGDANMESSFGWDMPISEYLQTIGSDAMEIFGTFESELSEAPHLATDQTPADMTVAKVQLSISDPYRSISQSSYKAPVKRRDSTSVSAGAWIIQGKIAKIRAKKPKENIPGIMTLHEFATPRRKRSAIEAKQSKDLRAVGACGHCARNKIRCFYDPKRPFHGCNACRKRQHYGDPEWDVFCVRFYLPEQVEIFTIYSKGDAFAWKDTLDSLDKLMSEVFIQLGDEDLVDEDLEDEDQGDENLNHESFSIHHVLCLDNIQSWETNIEPLVGIEKLGMRPQWQRQGEFEYMSTCIPPIRLGSSMTRDSYSILLNLTAFNSVLRKLWKAGPETLGKDASVSVFKFFAFFVLLIKEFRRIVGNLKSRYAATLTLKCGGAVSEATNTSFGGLRSVAKMFLERSGVWHRDIEILLGLYDSICQDRKMRLNL